MSSAGDLDACHRVTERQSRRKIEGERHRWKLALMGDDQRHVGRFVAGERAQGHLGAARRGDVNIFQSVGILPILRLHLHHHMILIERGVHGRHLALAKGIVERIVDGLGAQPESRRGRAIDDQAGLQSFVLLIAIDVEQSGQGSAVFAACAAPRRGDPERCRSGACTDIGRWRRGRRRADPAPAAGKDSRPETAPACRAAGR